MKPYVKVISWNNGTRQISICRPDEKPENIDISNYDALQIAADLIKSVPYSKVSK